jgi:hypothetical protein
LQQLFRDEHDRALRFAQRGSKPAPSSGVTRSTTAASLPCTVAERNRAISEAVVGNSGDCIDSKVTKAVSEVNQRTGPFSGRFRRSEALRSDGPRELTRHSATLRFPPRASDTETRSEAPR